MTTSEPLVICTAWNANMAPHGALCSESILQHIRRVEQRGGSGITFTSRIIPDDYPRAPSWFKIDLLRELLATNNHVLWIDTDALLIDQGDIREVIGYFPLQICKDENGPNGGVMAWQNVERNGNALDKLAQVDALYETFKDHHWWEQAAIMKLIAESPSCHPWWQWGQKEVFNAFSNEICPTTRIIHFPGFKKDEQLKLMEAQEIAIRRNGHGPSTKPKKTEDS